MEPIVVFIIRRPQDDRLIERLDPGYWHPAYDEILEQCRAPLLPLGDFIERITYGAIVTGRSPEPDPDGLALIGQGCLRDSGVDCADAVRVSPDSPWGLERCRVRTGDLLLARSGEGSLARNRLGVYHDDAPAVVDCFVDVLTLAGIAPDYVAAFLRTRFGWAQIHRLINGVGPSNLSFDEIRSLRVAVVAEETQREVTERYAAEVLPLHRAGEFADATAAMRAIVTDLERELQLRGRIEENAMADSLFDGLAQRYDAWFDSPDGAPIFAAEARCVGAMLEGAPRPWLEVGVGTGRFAEALGIEEGLDPSRAVLEIAARRGVDTRVGLAEELPYEARSFGGVVMVVTICFVDDAQAALGECAWVLADGGSLIVGLVPAASLWGEKYARQGREGHVFYSEATFYTCEQVIEMAREAGLGLDAASSCIFTPPDSPLASDEPLREGVSENAGFVAMRFRAE